MQGMGGCPGSAALTPRPVSVQSLDSCMELDSLRERMQRIHVETEGRDEMRLLQQDREEGEGQGAGWVCRVGVHVAHLCVCCSSVPYIFHDVWFRGAHGMHVGQSKGWLMWLGTGQLSTALTQLQGSPLLQILMGKSPVPPTLHATCRTLTLDTKTLPGVMRIRRRYSESR